MSAIRVVVIVSQDRSDLYFANQLLRRLNVVGILVEQQYEKPGIAHYLQKALKYAVAPWLIPGKIADDRVSAFYHEVSYKIDMEHFGDDAMGIPPSEKYTLIHTKGKNAINDAVYVEQIRQLKPDVIAVCGASILRGDILSLASKGILNLHGGLSQAYRGLWTTGWAIYNEQPEYVGATVHYVATGIDDGEIIYQGRPEIDPEDNPESLYAKVVKQGVKMMIKAIEDIQNGKVKSYRLEKMGKLYFGKMVTPAVLKTAWGKAEAGVITKYLSAKEQRDYQVERQMKGIFHA